MRNPSLHLFYYGFTHVIIVACPHPLSCCIYAALVSLLFGTVIPTSFNILMEMFLLPSFNLVVSIDDFLYIYLSIYLSIYLYIYIYIYTSVKTFLIRLADLISSKQSEPYSVILNWIRTRLSFSILQSSIMCIRGTYPSFLDAQ